MPSPATLPRSHAGRIVRPCSSTSPLPECRLLLSRASRGRRAALHLTWTHLHWCLHQSALHAARALHSPAAWPSANPAPPSSPLHDPPAHPAPRRPPCRSPALSSASCQIPIQIQQAQQHQKQPAPRPAPALPAPLAVASDCWTTHDLDRPIPFPSAPSRAPAIDIQASQSPQQNQIPTPSEHPPRRPAREPGRVRRDRFLRPQIVAA